MQQLPAEVKECTKCFSLKSFDLFSKNQSWCKKCKATYYQLNKEKINLKNKQWAIDHPEQIKAIKQKNYDANKSDYLARAKQKYAEFPFLKRLRSRMRYAAKRDLILEQARQYYLSLPDEKKQKSMLALRERDKKYPHIANARTALRRARLLRATPKWLTEKDKQDIAAIYQFSKIMELATGEKHHVDHVIPLRGKNVCGLHVPSNLIPITAKSNMKKSNIHEAEQ